MTVESQAASANLNVNVRYEEMVDAVFLQTALTEGLLNFEGDNWVTGSSRERPGRPERPTSIRHANPPSCSEIEPERNGLTKMRSASVSSFPPGHSGPPTIWKNSRPPRGHAQLIDS